MNTGGIKVLFLDIGGVLLTNGFDQPMRKRAAEKFGLDFGEMDERHSMMLDVYERGRLTLDSYLERVVFHQKRPFTAEEFKKFLFCQSKPYPETIDLMRSLARQHRLPVVAVNNEGRELNLYRIGTFGLTEWIQFFVSSCFVGVRKPDEDIYRIALDAAQTSPDKVAYIDDRLLFVEVARSLGIHSIYHTNLPDTRNALAELGLSLES